MIIGILADSGNIDPVVVWSCIFMEDETSKAQVDGIVKKVNEISLLSRNLLLHFTHPLKLQKKIEFLKHRLIRLHKVLNNKYPGNSQCLPSPAQINIQKLGHGGVITTNTCNQAQKGQCLICDQVLGALDYDCMNHLRNVWFGATEKGCTVQRI